MKKSIIIALALGCLSGHLSAQETFGSLYDVWNYALSHNADNLIQQMQIDQAGKNKREANSFLYPKITAGINGQDNIDIAETPVPGEIVGQPGKTVFLKFGKKYNYSAGISVNYSPLDWQAIYQSKIAKVNLELKTAGKSYFEQNLKKQIAQFYFAALTAKRAVEIGGSDLATADTLLWLTQDRFKQGTVDALAVNKAQINRNTVQQKLESSKQYRDEYFNNLKILLGLNASQPLELSGNLPGISQTGPEPEMLPNQRFLENFRLQSEMSAYEAKKAKAAFVPKIGINGYFGKYQFQDNLSFSFSSANWQPNNYIGVSISIPVFTGFSSRSRYAAAKIDKQVAMTTYQEEIRKSAINDSTLYSKYNSSMSIALAGSDTYRLSHDNLKLARKKYEQGLLSLDGYLNVFDDYLSAENQYLNNLSEFLTQKAVIESRK
ncbi:TolC family protein [Prolixibacter sp. SD074]|uniref:TolC family protein n=1 Tax=Prolixibacter sp. SD074 TaxID=2652391 RepID=UPI001275A8A6|nr:TolC family protein [Prolixibacter sp. SD074]GET29205.1 transporter [Prolixibacter sp. SD074]